MLQRLKPSNLWRVLCPLRYSMLITERVLDKFSIFSSGKGLQNRCFRVWGHMFRFSGVFCVDCALVRPKRPPGARFGAKTKFQKQLDNLSNKRSVCQEFGRTHLGRPTRRNQKDQQDVKDLTNRTFEDYRPVPT